MARRVAGTRLGHPLGGGEAAHLLGNRFLIRGAHLAIVGAPTVAPLVTYPEANGAGVSPVVLLDLLARWPWLEDVDAVMRT